MNNAIPSSCPATSGTELPSHLDAKPPSSVIRALALLLACAAAGAAWVVGFVSFPETISAPFSLVSTGHSTLVTASRAGMIERIDRATGPALEGQPLLVIRAKGACNKAEPRTAASGENTGEAWCPVPILAPHDGEFVLASRWKVGDHVDSGQPLGRLDGKNSGLDAEIRLDEDRLAEVAPGDRVRFLFRALPFGRYGTWSGKLTSVESGITDGKFRARASLEGTTTTVEGKRFELRPGMTGEARIQMGSRTLLESLFEPLRELRQNSR